MAELTEPTFEDVLQRVMDRSNGKIRTALPAEVVSYDKDTQKANVQAGVAGRFEDPDTGEWLPYRMEPIVNVPVLFPAGGGFSITWPLEAGDNVYLVIAERSIDEWKSTGGTDVVPADVRRFDLSDAVAIPGVRPFSDPLEGVEDDTMVVDVPDGMEMKLGAAASEFVALASAVNANWNTLASAVDSAATGDALLADLKTAARGIWPEDVSATKVKAE